MDGKDGGLVAVITTSIVLVAATYLAIHYSGAIGTITKATVKGAGTLGNAWQN